MPAQLWRHDGATFVTSFFLHGGLLHLIGNVYFLLIFGDNVEDDLGRWGCVAMLAVAAFVGDLWHILGNLHSTIPCIGASGGISGIITYYALRFPRARLGFLFRIWFYFRWIHIPAYVALLFWFLLQFLYVFEQQVGVGNVGGPGASGRRGRGSGACGFSGAPIASRDATRYNTSASNYRNSSRRYGGRGGKTRSKRTAEDTANARRRIDPRRTRNSRTEP